jgi:uncharacterized membrane protein
MSDSNQLPSNKSKVLEFLSDYWLIILMFILIIVAFSFAYYVVTIYQHTLQTVAPTSTDRADWGTTGDFFGGVLNPIFAFLGLIMLLATLFQSQRELSLTRKELELSRKAAEESEKALADQALTQKQQRFENTFFALLEQHNEAVKTVENLNLSFKRSHSLISNIYDGKAYLNFDLKYPTEIKRYFMILHQTLKALYTYYNPNQNFEISNIKNIESISKAEQDFGDLIKAFISDDVGSLLILNCLQGYEQFFQKYPKMKALAERYRLFEHIDFNKYLDNSLIKEIIKVKAYDARAFGQSEQYHQACISLENQTTQ